MSETEQAALPPAFRPGAPAPDLSDPGQQAAMIEGFNSYSGELATKLGITITEVSPDRLVGTMPVEGNRQPYGLLHGGASAVLAESLGSYAASLNAPEGRMTVGVDLNATHHRSARAGVVTGVCTPLHRGRTTSSFQIEISDEDGRRVCTARLTCQILPPR